MPTTPRAAAPEPPRAARAAAPTWPCGGPRSGYNPHSDGRLPPAPPPARRPGADMLDAFIIDKIRRDRESKQRDEREQLRIDMPRMPSTPAPARGSTERPGRPSREDGDGHGDAERGVVIVDFTL